jgi:serine/threonine protein kinase
MIGTTLGHYRIDREIGSGGMGVVYAAEDLRLHRQVAVKVVSGPLASDAEFRQRFEREAQTVASLNHPNIVTLHSVEQAGDVHFLTMELVEGEPLSRLIPPRGLPLDRLLAFAVPLADAVSAAHQRGITHRDLKPANVMVTRDGRVKVLDFGLAKLKEGQAQASGGATTLGAPTITGEGRILGTVAYMSPEQAEGRSIDHRSDIFSLGIVLYEMATGERPFKGDTSVSIISSILKDSPRPVSDVNQSVPRDLNRIVRRCLMKDPEQRYQSAKDTATICRRSGRRSIRARSPLLPPWLRLRRIAGRSR